MNYFKSIPSHSKVYNKVLVLQNYHKKRLNFRKVGDELAKHAELAEEIDSSSEELEELATVELEEKKTSNAKPK